MPLFLDTRGRSTLGIGICARCSRKMSLDDLMPDPNAPGLMVCKDDRDQFDPYRLPARETEDITLRFARPDISVATETPMQVYADQIDGIDQVLPNVVWTPATFYAKGATMTSQDPNSETTQLPIPQYLCIVAGISGATAPNWPTDAGVEFTDGGATWLCLGIYIS